tara:strand:+ start:433 stop:1158 length:726 start_codon:yes stop_codon:yes gene_type:complete
MTALLHQLNMDYIVAMPQSLLLIEDEAAIADNVRYALEREGFEVHWSSLGEDGLRVIHEREIHLILLDVGLPDVNGFELCKEIRSFSQTPIIFLTARSEEVDRVVGLEIGGDDYVVKPFSTRELIARVKAVLKRSRTQNDAMSACNDGSGLSLDESGLTVLYRGSALSLTPHEQAILKTLLNRPGRIYSRAQLLDLVWADREEVFERVVDTHIKSIRSKLREIDPEATPIKTHRGFGYSVG